MNSLKSIAKGGWHPENKSNSSSGSKAGDNERFKNFKGLQQVANWTGHGTKGGSNQDQATVTSRPLTSLKDPYSFGAPPKRDPKAPLPPPTKPNVLDGEVPHSVSEPDANLEEEPSRPRGFQLNTTGISTTGLPAPPKRVLGTLSDTSLSSSRPTPPLPGRNQPPPLPGRHASASVGSQEKPSAFPSISGPAMAAPTAAAAARLGQAGVSVPGLDIEATSAPLPSRSRPNPPPRPPPQQVSSPSPSLHSVGGLTDQFSSMKMPSALPQTECASGGTSWAQKKSALKTASQLRKDPTSVPFSDAAAAAKTADNFRQRHGDQVAQGYRQVEAVGLVDESVRNRLGEKSTQKDSSHAKWGDVASRAPKITSHHENGSSSPSSSSVDNRPPAFVSITAKKKPPPPPKPKVLESTNSPPPIPFGTKPK